MKLSPPKVLTWWIAVIAGVLGILIYQGIIAIVGLSGYAFWFEAGAFILLTLGALFKGL